MALDFSSPHSALGTLSFPISLALGFGFVMLKLRQRGRMRLGVALRYLLSRRIWLHRSALLDYQFLVVGSLLMSVLTGYTIITGLAVSFGVCEGLTRVFGPQETPTELPFFVQAIIVLGLYLSIEFAYWLDHWLMHKIAFLWEFHKVHHSAHVLTPFSTYRTHPIDNILYANILSLVAGSASGVVQYFAGESFSMACRVGSGLLFTLYLTLYGNLQHSHIWISWRGLAGRIFLSPAHHQIHHSNNPIHFDKNFGAGLGIYDWLFGTLHMPQREQEHLQFGTHGDAHLKSLIPSMLYPFHYAAKRLIAMIPRRADPTPVAPDPLPAPNSPPQDSRKSTPDLQGSLRPVESVP